MVAVTAKRRHRAALATSAISMPFGILAISFEFSSSAMGSALHWDVLIPALVYLAIGATFALTSSSFVQVPLWSWRLGLVASLAALCWMVSIFALSSGFSNLPWLNTLLPPAILATVAVCGAESIVPRKVGTQTSLVRESPRPPMVGILLGIVIVAAEVASCYSLLSLWFGRGSAVLDGGFGLGVASTNATLLVSGTSYGAFAAMWAIAAFGVSRLEMFGWRMAKAASVAAVAYGTYQVAVGIGSAGGSAIVLLAVASPTTILAGLILAISPMALRALSNVPVVNPMAR